MATNTNVIGSLLFCPECGNLLDVPGADDDILLCNQCSYAYQTAGNRSRLDRSQRISLMPPT